VPVLWFTTLTNFFSDSTKGAVLFFLLNDKDSFCAELFGVSVSETMAARGLVNGRGPLRSSGRDSEKRVVSDTDIPKSSLE